jgi:hypothetical protein
VLAELDVGELGNLFAEVGGGLVVTRTTDDAGLGGDGLEVGAVPVGVDAGVGGAGL